MIRHDQRYSYPQVVPSEDVETVSAIFSKPDEDHDKFSNRAWLQIPSILPRAYKYYVTVQGDVSE